MSVNEKNSYPNQEQHRKAWETLARNIANTKEIVQSWKAHSTLKSGELIIIGSGIQALNFIRGDEKIIKIADVVFYCVADPATVTWIKTLRPDAYDLYVLYGNHKMRYTTYVQMTEAMLYYVRQGKKVVAIYYGHPGIFALSPHRAIFIAKREGHKAIMKPNVSALDCLCADLGVDPAHPGLQTHEATDLLIRKRRLDTSLHIVLWQVGLIGDQSFRDQGYINQHFPIFIDYLQSYYGQDYLITHYIASRYPTLPPVIESYPLNALYDPKIQLKINGISTFYVPPKTAAQVDSTMLQKFGMLKPGQTIKPQTNVLREMGSYGPREMLAFQDFKQFKVPTSYRWQADNVSSRFIINLQEDPLLQSRYTTDPATVVAEFPGLTPIERRLLASRDSNNIQSTARGLLERSLDNETFLYAFFSCQTLVNRLLGLIKQTKKQNLNQALTQWLSTTNYAPNWLTLYKSLTRITREKLYVWTGIYFSEKQKFLITIHGHVKLNYQSLFYFNGQRVKQYQFSHGVIEWRAQGKIPSGLLRLDIDIKGRRRIVGTVGSAKDASMQQSFFALEVLLNLPKNSCFSEFYYASESYRLKIQGSAKHKLKIQQNTIRIDDIQYPISIRSNYITSHKKNGYYCSGNLLFFIDPITSIPILFGKLENLDGKKLTCQGYSTVIKEIETSQNGFFDLPSPTWSMLVRQCQQDKSNGHFLWFIAYKIQRAMEALYYTLNKVNE